MSKSGFDPSPRIVQFSPEARRAWLHARRDHRAAVNADDFPGDLDAAWGKLGAYSARLILILHLLDLASDPTRPSPDEPPDVPPRIVHEAFRLIGYFKAHTIRVYARLGSKGACGGDGVKVVLQWIGRNEIGSFTRRDLTRNLGKFFDEDGFDVDDAIAWIQSRNLIRDRPNPDPPAGPPRPGRKPSPIFEVHPAFLASPRFEHFRGRAPISSNPRNTRRS